MLSALLGDRSTYRRGGLRRSLAGFRRSPLSARRSGSSSATTTDPTSTPTTDDTTELVEQWRTELFGEGTLNATCCHRVTAAASVSGALSADETGTAPVEHLDVLVVGAGLSGIGAAHHLQADCPWASYAIFEARDAIGGTWDLFRYPGIRSDSDMYTLGYPFRPWDGRESIADGDAILQYIERHRGGRDGIDRKIRFGHRIVRADWSTDDARWAVTAERTGHRHRASPVELTCSFLISCTGYYRYDHGYQPDFEGMDRFGGTIVHPQHWPEDLDYTGKRVVVIGSGATAVTLVPSLRRRAAHVTMLQRSPTYVASVPRNEPAGPAAAAHAARPVVVAVLRWALTRSAPRAVPAEQASARAHEAGPPQGARAFPAPGLRHRHPLHPQLRPVGPAAVRRARRRPVQGHQGRHGLGGHRPHRHRSPRPASGSGRVPSSRPTSSSPPPASTCCSSGASSSRRRRREGRPRRAARLQGDDARGVPNLAVASATPTPRGRSRPTSPAST
jgi:cation diffusion facilitator CzcD-associated flavoprotein CzcO